ncbi:hypothetical protein CDL12_26027 [Handroanthus impetiginosus]|uniref:Uncharacterized protein n=1 Tax=Handroanthus impetiginosus TaxID=429701 RepID=A0A2G9G851_9LAMI|nr:hypothetical protein CDL12_26027 [Handroanthus impetiginosus]
MLCIPLRWLFLGRVGFYWPTFFKGAHLFITNCYRWQRTQNISKKHEMPLNTILEVELFDIGGRGGLILWDHLTLLLIILSGN